MNASSSTLLGKERDDLWTSLTLHGIGEPWKVLTVDDKKLELISNQELKFGILMF
jgi:hypothetical protein